MEVRTAVIIRGESTGAVRGSSSGSENKVLELVGGEQGDTLVIVIG